MAVFFDLEGARPAVLDRIAEAMQRADARIAAVGEDELACGPDADQLVVEDVRCHPDQLELGSALADQLVPGGKRDQVREALERDGVAIVDELGECLGEVEDLGHCARAPPKLLCAMRTRGRRAHIVLRLPPASAGSDAPPGPDRAFARFVA